MDEGWKRVGAAVKAGRARQNLTQRDLADMIGVSLSSIRSVERGTEFTKIGPLLRAIEQYLLWVPGSIESILRGEGPIEMRAPESEGEAPASSPSDERLPIRIARALREGATIDARVVPLTPDADMVVIIKGRPDAGPEAIQAALEAWERREGHLDLLADLPDDPSENS